MLYLLDANVLITANNTYYPILQIPEFWGWIEFQGSQGIVKIPNEIVDEILAGRKEDELCRWMSNRSTLDSLRLDEETDPNLVQAVMARGYAENLDDAEIETLGKDPFLIAYCVDREDRIVVTTEVSSKGKKRANRKIPDVCSAVGVVCIDTFELNRKLGFRTAWKQVGSP